MKKLLLIGLALLVTGCAQQKFIVKPEIVTVKYPIPYCPAITEIIPFPPIELETLKLTPEDKNDPGKVARAYHIDMINLTQRLHELQLVENQRAQDYESVKTKLEEYQAEVKRVHEENISKVEQDVLQKQKELNK
jgi:hypothetical protein